jgi:hypothetical protein
VAQCGSTSGDEIREGWKYKWVRRRVAVESVWKEK